VIARRAALLALATLPGFRYARAADARVYRLGHLASTEASRMISEAETLPVLARLGFAVGRNLVVDFRHGGSDQLQDQALAMLRDGPDAIMAIGGDALTAAARATRDVPIVGYGPSPVTLGLAATLARPGGNVTGIVILATELDGKRLQLLHEALPAARRVAALIRTTSPNRPDAERGLRAAAAAAGVELHIYYAHGDAEYAVAFADMRAHRMQALVITADTVLYRDSERLSALAMDAGLPAVGQWAEMVRSGCFLAYGPSNSELRRRIAYYVARFFRGANPAEMPIEQPTEVHLAVNLKTAKALGIVVPHAILLRADEVIE
jgi:putative tryptophan/tyrosine transport system substrate-binding protein